MKPMQLWLVRHAVVPAAEGRCIGASDWAADAAATQAAAAALAAALPGVALLWCSPRRRCRQLIQALAALRPDLPAAADEPRLAEMDFGAWEGRRWDEIARGEIDAWVADFDAYRAGGGESTGAVVDRVAQALADTGRALQQVGGGEALWVTHAGVIRAAQWLHQGGRRPVRLDAGWPREAWPNGAWCVLPLAPAG